MIDYDIIEIDNKEYGVNPIITEALLSCCSDKIKLIAQATIENIEEE